jgi:hypothetical protein
VDPLIEAAADSGPMGLSVRDQRSLIELLDQVRRTLSESGKT